MIKMINIQTGSKGRTSAWQRLKLDQTLTLHTCSISNETQFDPPPNLEAKQAGLAEWMSHSNFDLLSSQIKEVQEREKKGKARVLKTSVFFIYYICSTHHPCHPSCLSP